MAFNEKAIVKKNIFFSLENALIAEKGGALPEKAIELLDFLSGLSRKGALRLCLISGLAKEKALPKIEGLGLGKYFKPNDIFFVTEEYISGKADADRERHSQSLEKDPHFVDHYLKQHILLSMLGKGEITKEDSVLVGNDLLFDGFYTSRFSGIDFVLVKERLANRGEQTHARPSGVNYVSLSLGDFKKILAGKLPKQDTSGLEKMILDDLGKQLVGSQVREAVKKKLLERQGRENN